ncbi:MAG: hypothetical protein H6719_00345 [Sandaracinaceae bacterium]|nr:hypothetical protein [Sandaracinaceae bacterium]
MTRSLAASLALLVGGCSLVFDPGAHMGGARDAGVDARTVDVDGGGVDAGDMDGGGVDGGGGSDAGSEGLDPAEYCRRGAEESCAAVTRCCSAVPAGFDEAGCVAETRSTCDALVTAALDRDYFAWDPMGAWRAVEEGRALASTCELSVVNFYVRRQGYYDGLVGLRTNGESCTPVSRTPTEIGLAVLSCERDHACVEAPANTWTCRPLGAAGATCDYALQCAGMAPRCTSTGIGAGSCGAGELAGELCRASDECLSLSCEMETIVVSRCGNALTQDEVYCPGSRDLGP